MKVQTPKYLHKPFRILWFESDELLLIFGGLVLGMYVSFMLFPILLVLAFIIRRLKTRLNRGFVRHIPYFLGVMKFKNFPSFFETHFNE